MRISPLEMQLLATIARYYVITREQLQQLCCPDHKSGRSTRKHLRRLIDIGFVSRHSVQVSLPNADGAAPAYYPTRKGVETLASYFDDRQFLSTLTKTPRGDRLAHWIAIGWTHLAIEQAIQRQDEVKLAAWVNEWETINKDADTGDQFVLHTQLRETPPLSCSPDAAFVLESQGHKKVFYLEQDRATSSPRQIAARKSKGYAAMLAEQRHRQHFPQTTLARFSVLVVTTSCTRRDEIAKAVSKKSDTEHWLFAASRDVSAESFLHQPITVNTALEALSLVRPAPVESA